MTKSKLHIQSVQEEIRRALKPAVFFDLDGTVITTKSGKTFAENDDDWKLISGVRNLMLGLCNDDTEIIIVSNQGGIEQKFTTKEKFEAKIESIVKELDLPKNISCYYSPTSDKNDIYRKPHAGMFHIAALELSLYLPNSIYIGDASGKCEIPSSRVLTKTTKDKKTYITTGARSKALEVISEKEDSYLVATWGDSDLAASMEAGIKNYMDIDQILHSAEANKKK